MNPALSLVFFTTLIGAAQGLFVALVLGELAHALFVPGGLTSRAVNAHGSALAVLMLVAGLACSFLHLGRPERAWRAVAMWRTSWLSREVIALPLFIAIVGAYGVAHHNGDSASLWIGAAGLLAAVTLWVCTAMIYAGVKFLREWAHPLTVVNFTLLGLASGFTLAAAFASFYTWAIPARIAPLAALFTLAAAITRFASLRRNGALKPKSTMQSAIGVSHPHIRQISMGATGGTFNTREFFHGQTDALLKSVKAVFLLLTFALPLLLLVVGWTLRSPACLVAAFFVQYAGMLFERWFFYAQANHPQNIYYQRIS